MGNKTDIFTTSKMVEGLLRDHEILRDNDDLLYLAVVESCGANWHAPLDSFLKHRAELGVPSFETVRRSRQKAQEKYPELIGTKKNRRKEAEEDFKEFARS